MKNIITTALLLIGLSITVFCQTTNSISRDVSYSLDFVFTGEIKSQGDSVFSLQYTFSPADVLNLKKVILEDSKGQCQLLLGEKGLQGDMEVIAGKDKVKVIVRRYDKYNFPVLTLGEDLQGTRYPLYLSTGNGERLSAEQFKTQLKMLQDRAKLIEQTPVTETN